MQTVLAQLSTIPGVIGSMLCDPKGRMLANAFPSTYDEALLIDLANAVADGVVGLDLTQEAVSMMDLRFGQARVLLKPIQSGLLLVLCARGTNVYFLAPSLAIAATKLHRLRATTPDPAESQDTAPSGVSPTTAADRRASGEGPRRSGVAPPVKGLEELRRRLAIPAEPSEPTGWKSRK
jgi:predicted regulator of Ras-like GTPase activity (Roadblock/LC7/MglB family)